MSFRLSQAFISKYEGKQPNWGFNGLGYVIYKRSYARYYCKDCGGYMIDGGETRQTCDTCSSSNVDTEEFWQTCRRVVEGTFELQRRHVISIGTRWNAQKAQASAQEMFKLMWDFKFLPPGRGLWAMGTPIVMERGNGAALFNCFAGDTEIITRDGIVPIGDVVGTEQTLLTTNGKWVDAPINSFGQQQIWEITLTRAGTKKVIRTTENHRWFVRKNRTHEAFKEQTTAELKPGSALRSVYGSSVKITTPDPVGIQHGIVYGDGSGKAIMLCGEKDRELLEWFPKHTTQKYDYVCDGGGIRVSPTPKFFKQRPSIAEHRNYLLGWLMGYFAADGTCSKAGACVLTSKNIEDLRFVKSVCAVLGIGTYALRTEHRVSNLTQEPHTIHTLTLQRTKLWPEFFLLSSHRANFEAKCGVQEYSWLVEDVQPTDQVEEVFCATVPDTHAFALADNILTGNCGFISTQNIDYDFAEPFCFLFEASAHGVGVGFDVRGAGKITIVQPKIGDDTLVVEDSREGWSAALRRVLMAYVGKGTLPAKIDYSLVRPKGAPIKTFGGTASGHEALRELLEVDVPTVLTPGVITSTHIVDLQNVIGKCVVAGGARRSSEIALAPIDDVEFTNLKLDEAKLQAYRWNSNNSHFVPPVYGDFGRFQDPIMQRGEPGFVFLHNIQAYGRMADPPTFVDSRALGVNPCGEQSLEDGELCNVVETFPAHCSSFEDFKRVLKYSYLYGKTVTLTKTPWARTNEIMLRNRRIGLSMSGIIQNINRIGFAEHIRWCSEGYEYLKELDNIYSEWLCIRPSIKMTTVKPSGTVSLLCGATPGIHYPHAEYILRRVRFTNESPLLKALQKAGYPCEQDYYDKNVTVVGFPIHEANFSRGKNDTTIWEQAENAAQIQAYWSDNSVSITVDVKPEEADQIPLVLDRYQSRLKTISFLPTRDHGYKQPPYEEITKETYETLSSTIKKLDLSQAEHEVTDRFCDSDVCQI